MADDNLRCADADRERVVGDLREHYAAGRLTLEEFDERSDAAYAAKTFGDLAALTTDLPARPPEPVKKEKRPVRRVNPAWRGAATSWLSVSLVCTVIWLLSVVNSGHLVYFWPMWVAGPWGAMLLAGVIGGRYRQVGAGEDQETAAVDGDADEHREQIERRRPHMQMGFDEPHRQHDQRPDRRGPNHPHGEVG